MLEHLAEHLRERGWEQLIGTDGVRSRWRDPLQPEAPLVGVLAAVQREIVRDLQGVAGYERLHRQAERAKEGGERG